MLSILVRVAALLILARGVLGLTTWESARGDADPTFALASRCTSGGSMSDSKSHPRALTNKRD
jgi:hypothetical protein